MKKLIYILEILMIYVKKHKWEGYVRCPEFIHVIYDSINNKHILYTINENTGYINNYKNGRNKTYLPYIVHEGKPFSRNK